MTTHAELMVRNANIAQLIKGGKHTLQEIGDAYGITRERVRQIGEKQGVTPRRSIKQEFYDSVAEAVDTENLSLEEAALRFNIAKGTVRVICNKANVKPRRDYRYEHPRIIAMAEAVMDGMSMNQAAKGKHSDAALLARYCQVHGIKSKKQARWRDMSSREALIRVLKPKGFTWDIITEVVSLTEGNEIRPSALINWTRTHAPDVIKQHNK